MDNKDVRLDELYTRDVVQGMSMINTHDRILTFQKESLFQDLVVQNCIKKRSRNITFFT